MRNRILPFLLLVLFAVQTPYTFSYEVARKVTTLEEGGNNHSVHQMIGFRKGDVLNVSMFNPKELSVEQSVPWKASVKLNDPQGNLITQTDRANIAPGKSHTFTFKRDEMVPARDKAGQLQVDVFIQIEVPKTKNRTDKVTASIEILNGLGRSRVKYPNLVLKQG